MQAIQLPRSLLEISSSSQSPLGLQSKERSLLRKRIIVQNKHIHKATRPANSWVPSLRLSCFLSFFLFLLLASLVPQTTKPKDSFFTVHKGKELSIVHSDPFTFVSFLWCPYAVKSHAIMKILQIQICHTWTKVIYMLFLSAYIFLLFC